MRFDGFIGPSYELQGLRWDMQRSLNLYLQVDESGAGKVPVALVGTPGIRRWGLLPTGPVRGEWPGGAPLTTGARFFVVSGSRLYEVGGAITAATPNAIDIGNGISAVDRGDVGNDGNPALIFSNGDDLFIVSAGYAYVDRGGAPGDVNAGPIKVRLTITLTGLQIDPSDPTKLISLSLPFTLEDVGKFLDITGGTGFTVPNTVQILSVEPDVRVELYHFTDLKIDAADNTRVSSALHPFTQDDIAKFLDVDPTTGFTPQTVKILRVLKDQVEFLGSFNDLAIDPNDNTKLITHAVGKFAAGDIGKSLTITGAGRHPVYHFTDLQISGDDASKVASLERPFSLDDVGLFLEITGGPGFALEEVQIASVEELAAETIREDIHSYTDLVIDPYPASNYKMHSAARPFTDADIGKSIEITGGGTYEKRGFSDISIDSMNAHLLRSSDFDLLDSSYIGQHLDITGGTGFVVQTLTITALGPEQGSIMVNASAGDLGATGGTASIFATDGFIVQTVIIDAVDGDGIAICDRVLGAWGSTAGIGTEFRTYYNPSTIWATVSAPAGVVGSTGGIATLRAPGGFIIQDLKITGVDGDGVATVDHPLGLAGTIGGTGIEWGLVTVAVVDAPLGDAGSTGGSATEWFRTGVARVSGELGTVGSIGGTAIEWEHLRASTGCYLDNYFIAALPDSRRFYISPLEDAPDRNVLMWDPLDWGEKQAYPDNIVSMLADREQLYLIGDTTIEVWRNTGASPFPFQRYPDALIPQGCRAAFSPVPLANSIAWIGGDNRGGPIAWRARGYVPERISTHAIERAWGSYSTIADAQVYVYVEDGHQFWQISFPTADKTWVYDATASDQLGRHIWHERSTAGGRHRSRCHAFVFGKHLVGDPNSGRIFEMSLSILDDDGTPITRQRVSPHISKEELWVFYPRLELDVGAVANAADFTLDWSDNGGRTWSGKYTRTKNPSTDVRLIWNRLASARDRVFRMTSNSSVAHLWLAVNLLNPTPGKH